MAKEENTRASAGSEEIIQKIREILETKYDEIKFRNVQPSFQKQPLKATMEPFPDIPEPLSSISIDVPGSKRTSLIVSYFRSKDVLGMWLVYMSSTFPV